MVEGPIRYQVLTYFVEVVLNGNGCGIQRGLEIGFEARWWVSSSSGAVSFVGGLKVSATLAEDGGVVRPRVKHQFTDGVVMSNDDLS